MSIDQTTKTKPGQSSLPKLLRVSTPSRLHVAFALVGWSRLPARTVLSLRWTQVLLDERTILLPEGAIQISERMTVLLTAHEKRQRVDRWIAQCSWEADLVVTDREGRPWSPDQADAETRIWCEKAGLPSLSLNALLHPCLAGASSVPISSTPRIKRTDASVMRQGMRSR